MARIPKKCAFCDANAVTKGGEHLWDDWLNKELPKKTRFDAKKRLTLDARPIQFTSVGLREKVPATCSDCNCTWMCALTGKFKKCFSQSVLEGAPFSLDANDAALLAAFTFMKAAVKDYRYSAEPFFTRAERERFKATLAIPLLVKVWFAAHVGAARYTFYSNFNIVGASAGPLQGIEFFCYTYVVGKLVLQLLAPRWENVLDSGRPLVSLNPHSRWKPAASLFWPYRRADLPCSWPPSNYFGDDTIEQFFYRFHVPIKMPITIRY